MVKLPKVVPTPEEIQHARSILDGLDQKAQRSKMASMSFLQQNPENTEVKGARGEKRKEYLEL